MSSSPEHPGAPAWKTYDEWVQPQEPRQISMVTKASTLKEDFERFNVQDEYAAGDKAWGEVDLDPLNQNGWGGNLYGNNSSGW
ncbi:hypothetical protein BC940DRAFT_61607 [Gongronella butleri]|nr:hypothetical protein BC940DRAFT_61607 [Gongronella butleri]